MNSRLETLLANYHPGEEAAKAAQAVQTLFLVGISGAGKGAIMQRLLKSGDYHEVISHTTRQPRRNDGVMEEDGVNYHFISLEKAADMLEQKEFIEAKYYSGNVYGTSVAEFQKAAEEKRVAIGDIEIQGIAEYEAMAANSVHPVFVLPPSYEVWQQRWHKRWGDDGSDEDKKLRMKTAVAEIEHVLEAGYYFFVVNDDINEAVKQADEIAKSGRQDDVGFEVGRQAAEELLVAVRQQISTL